MKAIGLPLSELAREARLRVVQVRGLGLRPLIEIFVHHTAYS